VSLNLLQYKQFIKKIIFKMPPSNNENMIVPMMEVEMDDYGNMKPTRKECAKIVSDQDKWLIAFLAGVLFIIIASPWLYRIVNSILEPLGLKTADEDGSPTGLGLVTHGIVFILIVRLMMR